MRIPKVRITLDLDHELFEWVAKEVKATGKSRNEVIGNIIEKAKKESKEG